MRKNLRPPGAGRMTDAQKGDARQYGGDEVIQFSATTGQVQGRAAGAAPPSCCRSWGRSIRTFRASFARRRSSSPLATPSASPITGVTSPASTGSTMAASTRIKRLHQGRRHRARQRLGHAARTLPTSSTGWSRPARHRNRQDGGYCAYRHCNGRRSGRCRPSKPM